MNRERRLQHPFAEIGDRLLLFRMLTKLGQAEFAMRAGVKPTTYNSNEKGWKRPSIETAIALRDTYHLSLDWIYCGDLSGLRYEAATAIEALQRQRARM